MQYLWILAIVILVVLFFTITAYHENKRLKRNLKNSFGKKPDRKYRSDDMDHISVYWKQRVLSEDPAYCVDDITWSDLDMDSVFYRINSTCSSIGDEYLYGVLHDQKYDENKLSDIEHLIQHFEQNGEDRLKAQFFLSKLGKVSWNGVVDFFYSPADKRLKNHAVYPVLAIAALLSLLTILFNIKVGAMFLICVLIVNILVYYRTKASLERELVSVRYISSLMNCARKLSGLKSGELKPYSDRLGELKGPINKTGKLAGSILNQSPNDFVFEYIKLIFMMDFVFYNRVISAIIQYSDQCREIYQIVGKIDSAISIASYRHSLRFHSIPEFTDSLEIEMKDVVHPLLDEPVPNTITLKRCSLITGSNASGKSTFVKAVALNAILAQTIHTCLARRFTLKPCFTVTSMAVSDNLEAGDSYYISEIKSLKRVLDGLNPQIRCLCLIDEILKGTNTIERIAASAAILRGLSESNCLAIVATHDVELTEMTANLFDNFHFQEHITDSGIHFDYRIYPERATTKNAIRLLDFLKYDPRIIQDANSLADNFEKNRIWNKLTQY